MLERGNKFVKKVDSSRLRIAKLGSQHIKENSVSIKYAIISFDYYNNFK